MSPLDDPRRSTSPADFCRRLDKAGSAYYLLLQDDHGKVEAHDILGYDHEWVRTEKSEGYDPPLWRRWADISPVLIIDDHPDF